ATAGGKDKTARIWDASTGAIRHTLTGHTDDVVAVAFSPDGRRLATGGRDNAVKFWEPGSGKLLRTVAASANHSEEYRRVTAARKGPKDTPEETVSGGVATLDFSPDSRTVALGNYNWQVELLDVESGQSRSILRGFKSQVVQVSFHPDGRSLLAT